MAEKNYFNSIWESKKGSGFQVLQESEGNSVVDGVHILARVSGPSFFPDTTSRNNVHYPKEAWENAIKRKGYIEEYDILNEIENSKSRSVRIMESILKELKNLSFEERKKLSDKLNEYMENL